MPDDKLNDKQLIQKTSIINNKPYIDKQGIKDFIEKLEYPIYYFDFESFMEAIPRFDGSKAYSPIPFQYSLHKQYENGSLEHYEFLHKESADPRKEILLSMLHVLGNKGSIVVFNQNFEKSRLNELSSLYPEHGDDINKILERIIDLWEPFSKFDYYNPSQQGICSIKKVLPSITGRSYEDMDISNGGDASALYFKTTFQNKFTKEEREKVYSDLLKYCNLDTEGMVWIVDELKKIVGN
ncbi:MAG: DUF2779 domain-containing protein [Clostridium lundense]|nr:DUF2779 domain-containing protein [Clostridium lundense]